MDTRKALLEECKAKIKNLEEVVKWLEKCEKEEPQDIYKAYMFEYLDEIQDMRLMVKRTRAYQQELTSKACKWAYKNNVELW